MKNRKIIERIPTVVLLSVALIAFISEYKIYKPLFYFTKYPYDEVRARVVNYNNQEGGGYFSSDVDLVYTYNDEEKQSRLTLDGVSLKAENTQIKIMICRYDNGVITTKTNLLLQLASICLFSMLLIMWILEMKRFVRIIKGQL